MIYTIEVYLKPHFGDHHGEHIRHDVLSMGIKSVPEIRVSQLYKIEGEISDQEIKDIAEKLLIDPITEKYVLSLRGSKKEKSGRGHAIEVWLRHGVTDAVAESVAKAVRDLGIQQKLSTKTGHKYVFDGSVSPHLLRQIAEKLLVNPLIQQYIVC